jgi:tetraacyldisaccharide 4'-kinase
LNPLLVPLSTGFRLGVALRHVGYERGWWKTRRLARPVISIGNLTAGGTGKTPLVGYVAKLLLNRGWKPSILTRGYRRRSREDLLMVAPALNRRSEALAIGDEPALLARMLPQIPLVICADRFRGGEAAEKNFDVDAHILDDGFQHLALARNLDLLALDVTQPLCDLELIPSGRQREPKSALRRAQVVVLTRTDSADSQSLRQKVLRIHPGAKVFHCQTRFRGCTHALSGDAVAYETIRDLQAAAFCGIGNPQAFFADLRRWRFNLVAEDAFPDHHVYTGKELQQLAARARKNGAAILLTTQKDAVKFCGNWTAPLPILACEIEAHILEAEDFERTLFTSLEKAR